MQLTYVTPSLADKTLSVPNTTLRSRVLGKPLIKPFPSILPPQTVLDCILDENWRENGILHILDVVTWKGQDLADCDTPFRYPVLSTSSTSSRHTDRFLTGSGGATPASPN